MRRERKPSPLRGLMLFLLGALVGANAVYFVVVRDRVDDGAPASTTPSDNTALPGRMEVPLPIEANPAPATASPAQDTPVLPPPRVSATGGALPPAGQLLVPVQGITPAQLVDTFTDSRSEGRSHDAIDIMAPHGTPVLAVADGRVEKLFTSRLGGLTLYQFNRERTHAYYYAHLQGYAPGIVEQRDVKLGEVLGYVGVTGNSNPDGPHLHFAIFELGPEKQWWKGEAINPFGPLGGVARPR